MKTKITNAIETGLDRIDQIKKEIASCKPPKVCKAPVLEMWEDIPESNEN